MNTQIHRMCQARVVYSNSFTVNRFRGTFGLLAMSYAFDSVVRHLSCIRVHLRDFQQGPLDISDITPETCSLSWKTPLDDGGSPITNYSVEKMDISNDVSLQPSLEALLLSLMG